MSGVDHDPLRSGATLAKSDRELRQANEILRKASAYFAKAELVLCNSGLLRQKGAAAQHRKLRGSGGGGVVRSLVF
jgi:transposase-like protein